MCALKSLKSCWNSAQRSGVKLFRHSASAPAYADNFVTVLIRIKDGTKKVAVPEVSHLAVFELFSSSIPHVGDGGTLIDEVITVSGEIFRANVVVEGVPIMNRSSAMKVPNL